MEKASEKFVNISVDISADTLQAIEDYNTVAKKPVDISKVVVRALEKEVAKIEAKTGDGKYFHKVNSLMLRVPGLPSGTTYKYFLHLLEEDGCPLHEKFAALPITNAKMVKLDNGRVDSVLFTGHNCGIELCKDGVYEMYNVSENQVKVKEYQAAGSLITSIETYRRAEMGKGATQDSN